jgi:hypothetical protein
MARAPWAPAARCCVDGPDRAGTAARPTDRGSGASRGWQGRPVGDRHSAATGLLGRLAAAGQPVDRSGAGVVVEVYPAAALKHWGLTYRRYKGTAHTTIRHQLVDTLTAAAPWLSLGDHEPVCRRTDHALDAVIAALNARAAALGLTTGPAPNQFDAARTEGWIALPTGTLADLVHNPGRAGRTSR